MGVSNNFTGNPGCKTYVQGSGINDGGTGGEPPPGKLNVKTGPL